MLSIVECSTAATGPLIEDPAYGEVEFSAFASDTEGEPRAAPCAAAGSTSPSSKSWLLRLGCVRRAPRSRTPSGSRRWISRRERARHVVMNWRLRRPYLLYCLACAATTAFLLLWNLMKGMENNWNLPQWKHHRWEEALEVTIGVLIVGETAVTLCLLGPGHFFGNCWHIFDLAVALLTTVSIAYGLEHLGRSGEICEANVPLLMARFVLQPARMLAIVASTCRAQKMQAGVDELTVDFGCLPAASNGFGFEPLQDFR